uniref:RNA methyltransferase n=1 Tax=Geoglobus ahangari TaxID=113653 RepID=A0A7C4S5A4_9EURY
MIDVVLVELKIPENIGFIARVMKNFGFNRLVLYKCNLRRESYVTAAHAVDILKNAEKIDSLEEYLKEKSLVVGTTGIRSKSLGRYVRKSITPRELKSIVRKNTAILFGREDFGLFDRELKLCDVVVSIPTSEDYPVMNVSHAAAIILYELSDIDVTGEETATQRDVEILVNYFEELMHSIWYPRHRIKKSKILLKRVFGKAGLARYEIHHISGIIRKTLLYINHLKESYGKT